MKKTGGQAQGGSKPSEVRSSQLVPVNNASKSLKAARTTPNLLTKKQECDIIITRRGVEQPGSSFGS